MDERLQQLLLYARSSERIIAAMGQIKNGLDALTAINDLDPELAPEMGAALDGLNLAQEALGRAFRYADARLTVQGETP